VIVAPSAGRLTVGGAVRLTAGPGWVLVPAIDGSSGIELRKADAILTAQVVSPDYAGTSASLLAEQRPSLDAESAQIGYGDVRTTTVNGHDTSFVIFQATVASHHSGVLDDELICMVVDGNAVVVFVAARQGYLDPVIGDLTAMLESVGVNK
jgi:cellobiose phosphorylase